MDLLRSVQLLLQVEHVSSECPAACGRGSDQFLSLIVRHLLRISRLEVKFQGLWQFVGHLRLRVLVLQLCHLCCACCMCERKEVRGGEGKHRERNLCFEGRHRERNMC